MESTVSRQQTQAREDRAGVDLRMERIISHVLEFGVIISMLIIVLGSILTFVHHPDYARSADSLPRLITPDQAEFPQSVTTMLEGLVQWQGRSLVILGLFLLIATPVLRVVVSILAFLRMRDWAFTIITAIVLCFLTISFLLGHAH